MWFEIFSLGGLLGIIAFFTGAKSAKPEWEYRCEDLEQLAALSHDPAKKLAYQKEMDKIIADNVHD